MLLRGEFIGDVNEPAQPIVLGVWSVESDEDLWRKLTLLREGARTLLRIGVYEEKRLSFYRTTHVRHTRDINSDTATTVGRFANVSGHDLWRYASDAVDELQGFMTALD